jgi:hypothetical protein
MVRPATTSTVRTAFVEVEYDDDGAAMGGANYGRTIHRAEIVEVQAASEVDAERRACDKVAGHYRTIRRFEFKRWAS